MKKIVFLVAFVMLFKPALPVIDYIVNYQYISKVLCVNKAKPAMHCNGKCHLMKELAKASDGEKSNSSDKKNNHQETELLFFQEIKPLQIVSFNLIPTKKTKEYYSNSYYYLKGYSVFHPPSFTA